jgi:DNA-entry nuclease
MARRKKRKSFLNNYQRFILVLIITLGFYLYYYHNDIESINRYFEPQVSYAIDDIPEYQGKPYIIINNNIPYFEESDYTTTSYEKYGELDYLGRCTSCIANIGKDIMPTEERKSISSVKPTGWHLVKYDIVDGKYLYNRCHLIGFQLTGENANPNNLITCTRSTNTGIMLDYENKVANYIKSTNNHVLYRVTPIFKENNLVASGILMEGYSIEDHGSGIKFNIYIYNVESGIEINYKTGESRLA